MKRSSVDNPPRVGMVVRFARYSNAAVEMVDPPFTIIDTNQVLATCWHNGQYDIVSEPAECGHVPDDVTAELGCQDCRAVQFDAIMAKRPSEAPCNCAQSLALTDALRRIVAAIGDDILLHKRAPIDVLTEVNLIAREALK